MILKTKGIPLNMHHFIIGKVAVNRIENDYICVITDVSQIKLKDLAKAKAIITSLPIEAFCSYAIPIVHSIKILTHLNDEDIVIVNLDGVVNTLYRNLSIHNFLFLTERCNSNCLMCSQPPKDRDDTQYFFEINSELIPLIPQNCETLGITGGEPTLLGESFFFLLEQLKKYLPSTFVQCLTNGRSFAWANVTQRLHQVNHSQLLLAIPLYSDIAEIHDYVVQAKGAFNQTVTGIYNLARYNQRIEIRVVLHQITIPRLNELARFIYKNMPFVEHIAFMGLEMEGYTPYNIDKLWIDPYDYKDILKETVFFLNDFGMNVSIYNIPLCLLPEELWCFSRKSISDWKNIYFDDCKTCKVLEECGGMFKSSLKKHSQYIKAF